jgi:hypothetical protein
MPKFIRGLENLKNMNVLSAIFNKKFKFLITCIHVNHARAAQARAKQVQDFCQPRFKLEQIAKRSTNFKIAIIRRHLRYFNKAIL